MDIDAIRLQLKKRLDKARITHSLGVAQVAVELGSLMGEDTHRLEVAGLLHDCAKGMSIDEQLEYARAHDIFIPEVDLRSKGIIHARIGKFIAIREFGVNEDRILNAIFYHTTGHASMGRFEKIIFVADFLDPNREYKKTAEFRRLVEEDFERGVLKIIAEKTKYLFKRKEFLHPWTIEFYNTQLQTYLEQSGQST